MMVFCASPVLAQQAGSIRGLVVDKDFDVPLASVQITITETGEKTTSSDEGNYVFSLVPPGTYTLIFSKDGYARAVESNVVVSAGQMIDTDVSLSGDFTEMEEFVVEDLQISGTEAGLLMLRVDSPALLDSISSELISRAGASDAAGALRLVAGASVQDGKYAVIRGMPDRYVNSQMNAVRLPSADPDKRAVQLDQFPSSMIETVQVSKTFTPDQQGDASGGAVNVVLKGIPDEAVLKAKIETTFNPQVTGKKDFLTYEDGGVSFWGVDDGGREQPDGAPNPSVAGVSRDTAPPQYGGSLTAGGKKLLGDLVQVGGFCSVYRKQNASYYDQGVDDSWWVLSPGAPMTPKYSQGTPEDYSQKTALYDATQGGQEVQLGGVGIVGAAIENHSIDLLYMYSRTTEDKATLLEDTRGKEYYFPGYDVSDPTDPGNVESGAAPYLRIETLEYTERTADSLQLKGKHKVPTPEWGVPDIWTLLSVEADWTLANSTSRLNQPDKRLFSSLWAPLPVEFGGGRYAAYKPLNSYTVGNFHEIWKDIKEESDQYMINLKFPFEQWTGDQGYFKVGLFDDNLDRTFNQDSFSNFGDSSTYFATFDKYWSAIWPSQAHAVLSDPLIDVDYSGQQEISAFYYMMDIPLTSYLNLVAGERFESTKLTTILEPETYATQVVPLDDVSFEQDDQLPAVGFVVTPWEEKLTLRVAYTETVARQTFKELTPIIHQEYLGGEVFIGNPELGMSALKNYDFRLDYTPYESALLSVSYFFKDIKDPIETVQDIGDIGGSFIYTTVRNYPKGRLSGIELEARQSLGHFWDKVQGLSVGGNATFIDSEVTLPDDEVQEFMQTNVKVYMPTRDMTNAPEYLFNLYMTYDVEKWGSQFGIFYTFKGDTLVAGAGLEDAYFLPNVYALGYGTLNLSFSQKFSSWGRCVFQIKNLLDPDIQEVYRYDVLEVDQLKTSYNNGVEYTLSVNLEW